MAPSKIQHAAIAMGQKTRRNRWFSVNIAPSKIRHAAFAMGQKTRKNRWFLVKIAPSKIQHAALPMHQKTREINQICRAMLQGGASNRNIAASSFGTDGFVFLLRYSAGPTTKSLIRHTCRHAYTSFQNYYIKLCVGAACAGFISFLLHFDFHENFR